MLERGLIDRGPWRAAPGPTLEQTVANDTERHSAFSAEVEQKKGLELRDAKPRPGGEGQAVSLVRGAGYRARRGTAPASGVTSASGGAARFESKGRAGSTGIMGRMPSLARSRYTPRRPGEKSYSGAMSGSALRDLLISSSFSRCGRPCGDDPDALASIRVDDNQESTRPRRPDRGISNLISRVVRVDDRERDRHLIQG